MEAATLTSEREVCAVAREMGRVLRPGGRAMILSVPKSDCAVTQDEEWGCPRCFWKLRGIEKAFWPKCLQAALSADTPGGEGGGYILLAYGEDTCRMAELAFAQPLLESVRTEKRRKRTRRPAARRRQKL